jgi:hypothetical protein
MFLTAVDVFPNYLLTKGKADFNVYWSTIVILHRLVFIGSINAIVGTCFIMRIKQMLNYIPFLLIDKTNFKTGDADIFYVYYV